MKLNKQKIENIKNVMRNIREKSTNNNKEQVPKKYYALLILMLMLGIITLSNNIKEYSKSKQENFDEYQLEEKQANANNMDIVNYITDESSISTNISTIEDEVVETISNNNQLKYIMPVDGKVIKEYATEKLVYSETLGMWKTHPGIDIKAQLGTSVRASNSGIIKSVEQDSFYGNTIKIEDKEGYIFVYSNLDNNIILKEGDNVKQGEIIGKVGVSAAGELADETHLHFEIIKDQTQVNPQDLIN